MARNRLLIGALAATATAALTLAAPATAFAAGTTYSATLNPVNHSGGSGSYTLVLNGDQATITGHWSGLAAKFNGGPFPHVQHIHIAGKGECPTASADTSGDGVISTPEGGVAYGNVGTTLSVSGDTSAAAATNIKIAPSGPSTDYSRTITLDAKTLASIKDDTAVIVVHGLDPSTLSKKAQAEKSPLVPSLPLAATAPALCGPLHASPSGPNTGTGTTAGIQDEGLLLLGGGMIAAAMGALAISRRRASVTR